MADYHLSSLAEVCRANCTHLQKCKLHISEKSARTFTPKVKAVVPDYSVVQLWCGDFVQVQRPVKKPAKGPVPSAAKERDHEGA